jgi:ribosomal protein S5
MTQRKFGKVPIIKGTVPHEQYGKYSGGSVLIKPAVGGTGVLQVVQCVQY